MEATAAATSESVSLPGGLTLEGLVDAYGDGVLQLAYFYVKDRSLAEDIFQEVFTRVYLNLHRFRGESSPRTWIYRIAMNLCRDKLRSPALRRVVLLGSDLLAAVGTPEEETAEEEALAAVDRTVLLDAVTALPLEYRDVILLYYYEEMDTREVAQTLGLTEGTIRSRLHRARAKLKRLLTEGGAYDDRG